MSQLLRLTMIEISWVKIPALYARWKMFMKYRMEALMIIFLNAEEMAL